MFVSSHAINSHHHEGADDVLAGLSLAACGVTAILGVAAAFMPIIPGGIRHELLAFTGLLWVVILSLTGSWGIVSLAITSFRQRTAGVVLLGVTGILAGILISGSLFLTRTLQDHPALTWNIDWRFALNHAQAISRSGGVGEALAYQGTDVGYHVGPAWLAGAVDRVFSTGLTEVLFGVVPVFSLAAMVTGLIVLLSNHAIPRRLAVAATGIAVTLPVTREPIDKLLKLFGNITHPDPGLWSFGPAMMLNSFFGMAVTMASLALLLRERAGVLSMTTGVLGLSSLVVIKPQYFAGAGLLLGIYAVGRLMVTGGPSRRTPRYLLWALCSLAIAVLLLKVLPGAGAILTTPTWAPGETGYRFFESMLLVLIIVTLGISWQAGERELNRRLWWLLVPSGVALLLFSAMVQLVRFPILPEFIERGTRIGISADFFQYASASGLGQGLAPLRLVLIVSVLVLLLTALARIDSRSIRRGFGMIGVAIVVSPLLVVLSGLSSPVEKGYEAAEDVELYGMLELIPHAAELVIASDLADPAQDHKRALRATLMTAYHGHRFYIANLSYGHYRHDGAAERLEGLRAFFGSPWSPWHDQWLAENGVTHILVHDRCKPVWGAEGVRQLRRLSAGQRWALYGVDIGRSSEQDATVMPDWVDMVPAYGRAECLYAGSLDPPN